MALKVKFKPILFFFILHFVFGLTLEKNALAISEENYLPVYKKTVLPYYHSQGKFWFFKGEKNIFLWHAKFFRPEAKNAIIILPGRTEPLIKYAEWVYDLRDSGYSIYLMNHRGQGRSGRIIKDRKKGYVEDFNYYVEDLNSFIKKVVKKEKNYQNIFLIAHSMGGAIAVLFAQKYPQAVDAIALSAPMLHIDTGGLPEFIAQTITAAFIYIGKGDSYVPGGSAKIEIVPFEQNDVTTSFARHQMNMIYKRNKQLALAAVTNQWLKESVEGTWRALKNAKKLTIPTLCLQAQQDRIIERWRQEKICSLAQNCTLLQVTGSRHEILMEKDEIRDPIKKKILNFFKQHSNP